MIISFDKGKGAVEAGKYLSAGIHKAKFMGIQHDSVQTKNGDELDVMVLKLDVDGYGEFTHNFFEPQSDERQEMSWGVSASQVDEFIIVVREILEALNPKLVEDLDNGVLKLDGTFNKCIREIQKATDEYVRTEVEVKILPQNNGFNGIPRYVAGVSKTGTLTIRTRFIGHNLTLNDRELKLIEAAKTATPTNMSTKEQDTSVANALKEDDDEDLDDLPF